MLGAPTCARVTVVAGNGRVDALIVYVARVCQCAEGLGMPTHMSPSGGLLRLKPKPRNSHSSMHQILGPYPYF